MINIDDWKQKLEKPQESGGLLETAKGELGNCEAGLSSLTMPIVNQLIELTIANPD